MRKAIRHRVFTLAFCISVFFPLPVLAQSGSQNSFRWSTVEPGFEMARYELGEGIMVIRSEVLLLKFSPEQFDIVTVRASDLGSPRTDVRTMTKQTAGIAGINAHFFGTQGEPLGLLISAGKSLGKIHRGGRLLTGVFCIQNGRPKIVHRDNFKDNNVSEAVQSGPRLVVDGKALQIASPDVTSRRSGIAVTDDGYVILFATMLRFPGASFRQLQEMLLDPSLKVQHALNFDGGGSSQLFVEKNLRIADETFISGGDVVPVGLIIKRKKH
jgi:uncharacterized protein YigE (DUF2233 family)